jgi:hypothetical protein
MSKKIMTLEAHREMGQTLQRIRNDLVEKSVELDGCGKSRLGFKLVKAMDLIDEVRCLLDDCLFVEYPDIENYEGCRYYY